MRLPLSCPKGPVARGVRAPYGLAAGCGWGAGAAGDVIPMTPLVRVCAIAGAGARGLLRSSPGCRALSFLSSGANVSLTIESDPPGADAKTSLGPSCRTPCMIPVPADRSFTVNYSLNGYLPQASGRAARSAVPIFRSTSRAIPGLARLPPTEACAQPGLCAAAAGAAARPDEEGPWPSAAETAAVAEAARPARLRLTRRRRRLKPAAIR